MELIGDEAEGTAHSTPLVSLSMRGLLWIMLRVHGGQGYAAAAFMPVCADGFELGYWTARGLGIVAVSPNRHELR
jgi:hypothetical protein